MPITKSESGYVAVAVPLASALLNSADQFDAESKPSVELPTTSLADLSVPDSAPVIPPLPEAPRLKHDASLKPVPPKPIVQISKKSNGKNKANGDFLF